MAKIIRKKISWTPSTSPDVEGYFVYAEIGKDPDYNSPKTDIGNVTQVYTDEVSTIPQTEDVIVHIGITAYDEMRNESTMVVIAAPFDFVAPDAPTDVKVEDA